ncbi:MAG: class II aldolase/adducin family protein [Gammaproteobacteria bacterium]
MQPALREAIVATARELSASGLNVGTAGNLAARTADAFLVTPTGIPYADLKPEQIVEVTLAGEVRGRALRPSSEWRIHRDIFIARPEVGATLHAHAPHATALACCRMGIPAFHYMVAVAGDRSIPCAPYAAFGTQALSDHVVGALRSRRACLMANHGMMVVGIDLKDASRLAHEVEFLARLYCLSLQIGAPVILSNAEMAEVLARFRTYGQQSNDDEISPSFTC